MYQCIQDPEGHSLWDLTWYKTQGISANLTPSLLADSGVIVPALQPIPPTAAAPAVDAQLSAVPSSNTAETLAQPSTASIQAVPSIRAGGELLATAAAASDPPQPSASAPKTAAASKEPGVHPGISFT